MDKQIKDTIEINLEKDKQKGERPKNTTKKRNQAVDVGNLSSKDTWKNSPAMRRQCKNRKKPNHFARICRSQQINEITETTESSEEECNLMQTFNSREDFEIFSIELKANRMDNIDGYIQRRLENKENCQKQSTNNSANQKNDISRDPKSESIKSPKSLLRFDNQIINITLDHQHEAQYSSLTGRRQNKFLNRCTK